MSKKETQLGVINKLFLLPEKKQEEILVKEIRDLISTRCFSVQLFKNQGLVIETSWISDMTIDLLYVYAENFNKWKLRKCITTEELSLKLKKLESRISSVCKLSDVVAWKRGINKAEFFEGLLEEAKK